MKYLKNPVHTQEMYFILSLVKVTFLTWGREWAYWRTTKQHVCACAFLLNCDGLGGLITWQGLITPYNTVPKIHECPHVLSIFHAPLLSFQWIVRTLFFRFWWNFMHFHFISMNCPDFIFRFWWNFMHF